MSTELRLDHEPQEKPQESCSRKPQKKIRIAAAATRGLVIPLELPTFLQNFVML